MSCHDVMKILYVFESRALLAP